MTNPPPPPKQEINVEIENLFLSYSVKNYTYRFCNLVDVIIINQEQKIDILKPLNVQDLLNEVKKQDMINEINFRLGDMIHHHWIINIVFLQLISLC